MSDRKWILQEINGFYSHIISVADDVKSCMIYAATMQRSLLCVTQPAVSTQVVVSFIKQLSVDCFEFMVTIPEYKNHRYGEIVYSLTHWTSMPSSYGEREHAGITFTPEALGEVTKRQPETDICINN